MERFTFTGEVWRHDGSDAWHFLTLPDAVADEIRASNEGAHRPFGSLPVRVTMGANEWSTSLFTDRRRGTYLLPVKASVRVAQGIEEGDEVTTSIEIERSRCR